MLNLMLFFYIQQRICVLLSSTMTVTSSQLNVDYLEMAHSIVLVSLASDDGSI